MDAPGAERQTFTYSVPAGVEVAVGHPVRVPFGSQPRHGFVVSVSPQSIVENIREIEAVLEPEPLVSPLHVGLADWIWARYLSTPIEALQLMLPPATGRRRRTYFRVSGTAADWLERRQTGAADFERELIHVLRGIGPAELTPLAARLNQTNAAVRRVLSKLQRAGALETEVTWARPRVAPRIATIYRLGVPRGQAEEEVRRLRARRAWRQADALESLVKDREPLTTGRSQAWKALVLKGLVVPAQREVRRGPVAERIVPSADRGPRHRLTEHQRTALERIVASLEGANRFPTRTPKVFLLHGVTGSGKTEVYLQALERTVALGKRGIVLVPEIALTAQMIQRFTDRFPGRVAVLHSGLSLRDQHDEWRNIRDGRFDVVIGPRRALFAPVSGIGLVVVDEEQEWSYKQDERPPRYHARDVAVELARRAGAVAVLGSATPDVASMRAALDPGVPEFALLRLPDRVSGVPERSGGRRSRPLPNVELVDLRDELLSGNRAIFSRSLTAAAHEALDAGGQVILFVNRRGAGSAVQCRSCGTALRCSRCSVSLTFHADGAVMCHQCGRRRRGGVPRECPACRRPTIKPIGIGTERVVAEAGRSFPGAAVARWDRDAVRQAGGHAAILGRFERREVDILVGTQMLAKGLDLPGVTLVGVVNADIGLHAPNFRAAERSYQLLCQVAGRAGRGPSPGRVVVQTYEPQHYAVLAAAAQDYGQFYRQELEFRRALQYPPFARMVRLVYRHGTARAASAEAARLARSLEAEVRRRGLESTRIIGPSPAPVARLRGRYRWQIEVLAPDPVEMLDSVPLPVGWVVDVDPVNTL